MSTRNDQGGAEPLIARDATYYRAPDHLRQRIRASIAAEARERARPAMWQWGGMAAAFATVALVSWNVANMQARGNDEDRLAGEISSAHVRSLMLEKHLNDVASTDQHTVKPWFEGKLDFAPVVSDFEGAGWTLIGGRLDYVNSRPVAALTYRHRLHVVNVFEWPAATPGDSAPQSMARQGFVLVHWKRAGLEFWAVSDVAGADLLKFAQLLSAS
jgi:anti-sigma factor RsiW